MSKGVELGPISDSVKVALIVVVGIFITAAVYQHGTPYHSCVRAVDDQNRINKKMDDVSSRSQAHILCAQLIGQDDS